MCRSSAQEIVAEKDREANKTEGGLKLPIFHFKWRKEIFFITNCIIFPSSPLFLSPQVSVPLSSKALWDSCSKFKVMGVSSPYPSPIFYKVFSRAIGPNKAQLSGSFYCLFFVILLLLFLLFEKCCWRGNREAFGHLASVGNQSGEVGGGSVVG
jgi:hypothetical protein